jgi:tetraacyldisaccharide-1-P 4'-kinase
VGEVVAAAQAANAVAVTTAKDAVKLPANAPVWVVEAEMELIEGSWRGLWRLLPGIAS